MKNFFATLNDGLNILTQNFVLGYPFFLCIIIKELIAPNTMAGIPTPAGLAYAGMMILIFTAFMAGTYQMVYAAVTKYFDLQKRPVNEVPKEDDLAVMLNPFHILKEFLPGVGQYFVSFATGAAVQLAVIFLIIWLVSSSVSDLNAVQPLMENWVKIIRETQHQQDPMIYLSTLTEKELMILLNFLRAFFLGMLGFFVFSMLTLFWGVNIVIRQQNVIRAYFESILCFFRHPFPVLGILFVYGFFSILFSMMGTINPFLATMSQFFIIFLHLWLMITLFVFVQRELDDKAAVETGSGKSWIA